MLLNRYILIKTNIQYNRQQYKTISLNMYGGARKTNKSKKSTKKTKKKPQVPNPMIGQ